MCRSLHLMTFYFRSISRKISAQCDLGDEIDFSELGLEEDNSDLKGTSNRGSNGDHQELGDTAEPGLQRSPGVSNGGGKPGTRRESRNLSQVRHYRRVMVRPAKFADFSKIILGSSLQFACLRTCFYQITPANSAVMFGLFFRNFIQCFVSA